MLRPMDLVRLRASALVAVLCTAMPAVAAAEPLRVGSKRFTESYILGEILAQSARGAGTQAEHLPGMGNTAILYEALQRGAIDAYPEYTGTIAREILKDGGPADLAALNRARWRRWAWRRAFPLGFSNGYALGMRETVAAAQGIATRVRPRAPCRSLRSGSRTSSCAARTAGPGLRAAYGLPQTAPRGLDHGIAYEALAAGQVDAIDIYTTDAKIARLGMRVLADDRGFFPRYDAVVLHRQDLAAAPSARICGLGRLAGAHRRGGDDPPQRPRRTRPRGLRGRRGRFLGTGAKSGAARACGRRCSRRISGASPWSTPRSCSPRSPLRSRWACPSASSLRACRSSRSPCSRRRACCRPSRRLRCSPSSSR